ncbi:helix-turn-helix transcriptional regulator [Clostridiaceae bacterium NSJ-33]|uniref:Helix-turn-helix transcriptional regulator n=1 Tax=Fumia xinanensis TaxID=2763659 RepID=A0A926E3Y1_9FIRM|nr:helix-turn-helix transcriptional regulator [Fumia xinanensis]
MLKHLRDLREDNDLSQTDIARVLFINQKTYSNYEREQLNIPIAALIKLAEFFETSVDYLLDLTDEPSPYPRKKSR